ncbi:hypothetical protein QBC43DRAFT_289978 [Cladorrhinum sp. PSN259]|nr:hypothetical protein QBC43DRAFT_289978 [Cladorrhinum sp. PSN259]
MHWHLTAVLIALGTASSSSGGALAQHHHHHHHHHHTSFGPNPNASQAPSPTEMPIATHTTWHPGKPVHILPGPYMPPLGSSFATVVRPTGTGSASDSASWSVTAAAAAVTPKISGHPLGDNPARQRHPHGSPMMPVEDHDDDDDDDIVPVDDALEEIGAVPPPMSDNEVKKKPINNGPQLSVENLMDMDDAEAEVFEEFLKGRLGGPGKKKKGGLGGGDTEVTKRGEAATYVDMNEHTAPRNCLTRSMLRYCMQKCHTDWLGVHHAKSYRKESANIYGE